MQIRDTNLFVEEQGAGTPVLFSHGLLWSGRMFEPQARALEGRYRVIRYDHRGQGRSDVPSDESISIETVYQDAVALIEQLNIAPCHFVGLSMGGFVGMRIATRRPELLRSLTLMATAADPEPKANVPKYAVMNFVAKHGGLRFMVGRVMNIMCGATICRDRMRMQPLKEALRRNESTIYRAVNGVLERASVEHELGRVTAPTLVMRGSEDMAIARERAMRLQQGIRDARYVEIPHAGHSLTLEQPEAVNTALATFLDAQP